MDLFLEVGSLESLVHGILGGFQPFLGNVVVFQYRVSISKRKPGCRHVGEHTVQAGRQHLGRMDGGAVEDQLGAFLSLGALLGDVGFARPHIIGDFLPMHFPGRAPFFQLG